MQTAIRWAVTVAVTCLVAASDVDAQQESRLRQLTDDPAQDGFPTWSPDGRTLVFSRYGGDAEPEKNGLWWVSPDGGEPQQLTTFLGEHPDFSPDGRYIAFDGDFGNSIQVVSATGGVPIRIVPESIPVLRGGQPKWSPDGTRIAFKEGPNLWVLDIATDRFETIGSRPGKIPIPACWSLDGSEIYVFLLDADNPNASIWAFSATGQGGRQITPEPESVYRYADLSPDGSLLAVVWCEGRNCDIWAMHPDGGPRVPITSHPAYDDGPKWSPDGTTIAFVSTRSGNFDIWTVEVDVERVRHELDELGQGQGR